MNPLDNNTTRVHSTTALRIYLARPLRLIVIRGPDTGLEMDLAGLPISIGSDPNTDLTLTDPTVSRFHGRLYPDRHWWMYRDLNSATGSFHNNSPIQDSALFPGEIIRLGHSEFSLAYREPSSEEFHDTIQDTGAVLRNGEWVQLPRIIAHELRHYIEFLDSGVEHLNNDPHIRKTFESDIKTLQMASHRMDELVQALRDGCIKPRMKPVNLTELLWEQIALIEPIACNRGITLNPDLPETDVMVRGDANQLSRAVLNLMKNSLEACREDDTIAVIMHPDPGKVQICITDTGSGMDSDTLGSIWVPLFTTKSSGNGLGAFLAKTIVRRHDGTIQAESGPGQGTKITLELPRYDTIKDT